MDCCGLLLLLLLLTDRLPAALVLDLGMGPAVEHVGADPVARERRPRLRARARHLGRPPRDRRRNHRLLITGSTWRRAVSVGLRGMRYLSLQGIRLF